MLILKRHSALGAFCKGEKKVEDSNNAHFMTIDEYKSANFEKSLQHESDIAYAKQCLTESIELNEAGVLKNE